MSRETTHQRSRLRALGVHCIVKQRVALHDFYYTAGEGGGEGKGSRRVIAGGQGGRISIMKMDMLLVERGHIMAATHLIMYNRAHKKT